MAELKAFSTLESLISSVLILLAVSFGSISLSNVLSSGISTLEFEARAGLLEAALSHQHPPPEAVRYHGFSIQRALTPYDGSGDLVIYTWIATDENGKEIGRLNQLIRTIP